MLSNVVYREKHWSNLQKFARGNFFIFHGLIKIRNFAGFFVKSSCKFHIYLRLPQPPFTLRMFWIEPEFGISKSFPLKLKWLTIKAGFVSITSDSMSSALHMNWRKIFKFCSSASVLIPIPITLTFARQSADLKTIDCH